MQALISDALAIYRVSRLLQRDDFPPAKHLRDVVQQRAPIIVVEAWQCPWCLPVYVGLGAVLLRRVMPRTWEALSHALAGAAVASLILTVIETED